MIKVMYTRFCVDVFAGLITVADVLCQIHLFIRLCDDLAEVLCIVNVIQAPPAELPW